MFAFQKDCGLQVVKDLVEGDKNLSRIYGFILYTKQDPYVAKVLRDDDFWKSLDSISGSNWPIFAARPLEKGKTVIKGGNGNGIGFMVQSWEEPESNLSVLQDFGLKDSSELPQFVVFMWDDKDQLNSVSMPIRGNDIDTIYHSIEEIVKTIAGVENAILPEYKGTENVYRNVVTAFSGLKFKYKLKSWGKIGNRIAGFLGMFQ